MGRWYCQQVVDGKVPACSWEVMACKRFLQMLVEARKPTSQYLFSIDHVLDACDFIEKLPHTKAFEGTVRLEPVQCWWMSAIFGFRDRQTGKRWVRQASLWIPRKNGKSLISAGIGLFCATCEEEPGPEVIISAGSEDQAKKVFGPIRKMLELEPQLAIQYRAKSSMEKIELLNTGGVIEPVATVSRNLDGYNPHVVIAEELHAQKQEVVSVLSTAQGSRQQPLFLSISTAGRQAEGAAWDDWRQCQSILKGKLQSPRTFVAMYAPDREDDGHHFTEVVLEKLNPLWGVSLNPTSMEKEMRDAKKSEPDLNEYKRTRLNIWTRAAGNLISVDDWDLCGDPRLNLEMFRGFKMYVGVDLASRQDLNAAVFMIKMGDTLYVTSRFWLPRNAPRMKDDRYADALLAWHREGHLTLTDAHEGTFIDQKVVLRDILEMMQGHRVMGVGLDDYQANLLASEVEMAGYSAYIVRKNAKALTPSTNDFVGRVGNKDLLQHDANPVSSWCAGNVVGYWDQNDNVLPKKERPGSRASIDFIDAAIIANAIRLDDEAGVMGMTDRQKERPNPYLERGLAGMGA